MIYLVIQVSFSCIYPYLWKRDTSTIHVLQFGNETLFLGAACGNSPNIVLYSTGTRHRVVVIVGGYLAV